MSDEMRLSMTVDMVAMENKELDFHPLFKTGYASAEVRVEPGELLTFINVMRNTGYRLVQMCVVPVEGAKTGEGPIELLYTLCEKGGFDLVQAKVAVPEDNEIISIQSFYPYAFMYENEAHDLFGLTFREMVLDYGGGFFRTDPQFPLKSKDKKGGK